MGSDEQPVGQGLDPDVVDALRRCAPPGGPAPGSAVTPDGGWSVRSVRRLSGGASRLTWLVDLGADCGDGADRDDRADRADGQAGAAGPGAAEPAAGATAQVIVQQERAGSVGAALAMSAQAELLRAAAGEGVAVPAVLADGGERGRGWVLLERLPGESLARRILDDEAYEAVRPRLARDAGRMLAAIHRIPRTCTELPGGDPLEQMTFLLDFLGEPHPAFELGLRWLAGHRPPPSEPVVVHGDFRMGNLLVAPEGITAVLDWELAHEGSAIEDLGWFCGRAWRFGSPSPAGGVGSREELLAGYAEGAGRVPDAAELTWWEAYGTLRWGLICGLQASTHLRGHHRSVELAAIGRRAAECEEDLLALIDGPSDEEPPPLEDAAEPVGPHDRPSAVELLDAVSEHLGALRGQLQGSTAFHLRVAGNVVDMVGREVRLSGALGARHRDRLAALGVVDDRELAEAIRSGRLDDHDGLHRLVRQAVRDKLAVSRPGYWRGDGPPGGGT